MHLQSNPVSDVGNLTKILRLALFFSSDFLRIYSIFSALLLLIFGFTVLRFTALLHLPYRSTTTTSHVFGADKSAHHALKSQKGEMPPPDFDLGGRSFHKSNAA